MPARQATQTKQPANDRRFAEIDFIDRAENSFSRGANLYLVRFNEIVFRQKIINSISVYSLKTKMSECSFIFDNIHNKKNFYQYFRLISEVYLSFIFIIKRNQDRKFSLAFNADFNFFESQRFSQILRADFD